MNPARLVDELARSRTRWIVYGSRFNTTGKHGVHASICLIAGVAVAEVHIARHLPSVARALARSGYTVRRIEWAFARRPLRRGELAREMKMLEALVRDPKTALPRRSRRGWSPRGKNRPVRSLIQRLRKTGWRWTWAAAYRSGHNDLVPRGWSVLAFVHVIDKSWINVGLQLWRRNATAKQARRLEKELHPVMAPRRYRIAKVRSVRTRKRSPIVVFDKRVRTFAAARTERRWLDRVLFG